MALHAAGPDRPRAGGSRRLRRMTRPSYAAAAADRPDDSGPVPSPGIAVCRIDAASGLCEGCTRTLDEIAGWGTMSEHGKRAVWARIALRRDAPPT